MWFTLLLQVLFHARYEAGGGSFAKPMSLKEEQEALRRLGEGDMAAREELIERNMRLVAHVARKYTSTVTSWESDDLISVGAIGLIKGIDTYDLEKKAKLSTYLARCIENEILMLLRSDKKKKQDISLQEPIGQDKEGNTISWDDVLVYEEGCVTDQVDLALDKKELQKVMESELTERERYVLCLRYGLNGRQEETQRQVAKRMGISRSYVSRIEKKALEKLQHKMARPL
ncbi:MAG: RNA polymerase sporulation sigma factor SigK [Lachnospiraceae bacterium]|jgi:RNA polymerase sporulation-specific sigma factor|nr:RNA polymerase sporulation sigma factor SigK [Lachnospiraceae bacterium]